MTDPNPAPADGGTDNAPAPNLVLELAAESLELTAWLLTPEGGYEPVDEPVPILLRATACRLQHTRPGHGLALCRHVYEVASAAAALALAVRNAPDPDKNHNLEVVNLLTRLETVPRATLPDALRAAARACKHASLLDATARPSAPTS